MSDQPRSDDPDAERLPADDRALGTLLRRQEKKLTKLERHQIGCNMQCTPIVVVNTPPTDPQCGICYIIYGTDECINTPGCEEEPCASACVPDVMGSPLWEPLISDSSAGDQPLTYDTTGNYYYQTIINVCGLIWPEEFTGDQSVAVQISGAGLTEYVADSVIEYIGIELRRHDAFIFGDGLRVNMSIWADGHDFFGDPIAAGWTWYIEWYDNVTLHDYIYEFYPDDIEPTARPGLGGDSFSVRLESHEDGTIVFSVDGIVYHSAVVTDAGAALTDASKVGFNLDFSTGAFRAIPPAETAIRAVDVCINGLGACDDFERTEIGPGWILGPGPGWADAVSPFTIDTGAAVGTVSSSSAAGVLVSNSMTYSAPQGTDQSVELTVENMMSPTSGRYLMMMTNLSPNVSGNLGSCACDVQTAGGDIAMSGFHFTAAGGWVNTLGSAALHFDAPPEPFKVRLDSMADGMQRFSINGVEAVSWMDPAPIVGTHCGFALEYYDTATSPRVLDACIGVPPCDLSCDFAGPWEDTFDRANGPVGSDWMLGPSPVFPNDQFVIVGNAAVGTAPQAWSMARAAIPSEPADQWIEITVSNLFVDTLQSQYTLMNRIVPFQSKWLQMHFITDAFAQEETGDLFWFWNVYIEQVDGNPASPVRCLQIGGDLGEFPGSTNPAVLRFESYLSGRQVALVNGTNMGECQLDGPFVGTQQSIFHNYQSATDPTSILSARGDGGFSCHPGPSVAEWLENPAAGFGNRFSGPPLRPEMRRELARG